MPAFTVVVSDQIFPSTAIERELLRAIDAELVVADGAPGAMAELAPRADAVLNTYLAMDAAMIGRLERCRIIARYGIGVDNVDVAAADRAGIVVTNVPDYSVQEVAAHTVALVLALVRRLPQADARVRGGGWGIEGLRPIRRVSELTFGLLGYGRIARRVAAAVEALGGSLLVHDPYLTAGPGLPTLVDLDELLAGSDVVSIHAPLTPETRGLFDTARIARMRSGSILINTSRGQLVDLDAVSDALRSGQLGGAGLDVFDTEPLDAARIDGVPNLLVSPTWPTTRRSPSKNPSAKQPPRWSRC